MTLELAASLVILVFGLATTPIWFAIGRRLGDLALEWIDRCQTTMVDYRALGDGGLAAAQRDWSMLPRCPKVTRIRMVFDGSRQAAPVTVDVSPYDHQGEDYHRFLTRMSRGSSPWDVYREPPLTISLELPIASGRRVGAA